MLTQSDKNKLIDLINNKIESLRFSDGYTHGTSGVRNAVNISISELTSLRDKIVHLKDTLAQ